MTIGSGIAVVGIWAAVAVSAIHAGPAVMMVSLFAGLATLMIASMG